MRNLKYNIGLAAAVALCTTASFAQSVPTLEERVQTNTVGVQRLNTEVSTAKSRLNGHDSSLASQGAKLGGVITGHAATRYAVNQVSQEMRQLAQFQQAPAASTNGLHGLNGLHGQPGQPGRDGRDGAPGRQGPQGIPGRDGPQGIPGRDGPQGIPGEAGETGATGPQGAIGEQGPPGERGFQGIRGVQGLPGRDGAPGRDGLEGRPGEKGEPGLQGERGIQGFPGKTGAPGKTGPVGPAGPQGETGRPGVDGAPGPTGPIGPVGPRGERGADGQQGPRGVEGPQGNPGPEGAEGPRGPRGFAGLNGRDGRDGQNGLNGRDGLPGAKGERGEKGERGAPGEFPDEYKKMVDTAFLTSEKATQDIESLETQTGALNTKLGSVAQVQGQIAYRVSETELATAANSDNLQTVKHNQKMLTNAQVQTHNRQLKLTDRVRDVQSQAENLVEVTTAQDTELNRHAGQLKALALSEREQDDAITANGAALETQKGTLGEHGTKILKAETALRSHGSLLDEHDDLLDEHQDKLVAAEDFVRVHDAKLEEQAGKLIGTGITLKKQGDTLKLHEGKLKKAETYLQAHHEELVNHEDTLRAHDAKLEEHGGAFIKAEDALNAHDAKLEEHGGVLAGTAKEWDQYIDRVADLADMVIQPKGSTSKVTTPKATTSTDVPTARITSKGVTLTGGASEIVTLADNTKLDLSKLSKRQADRARLYIKAIEQAKNNLQLSKRELARRDTGDTKNRKNWQGIIDTIETHMKNAQLELKHIADTNQVQNDAPRTASVAQTKATPTDLAQKTGLGLEATARVLKKHHTTLGQHAAGISNNSRKLSTLDVAVGKNQKDILKNQKDIKSNTTGLKDLKKEMNSAAALSAALSNLRLSFTGEQNLSLSAAVGAYNSNVAFGAALGGRLSESTVLHGSIATDSDADNVTGGVGLTVSF